METDDNYLIEVVDSSEIPESELSQFKETQPLELADILQDGNLSEDLSSGKSQTPHTSTADNRDSEEILIQKFISGELELPDMYTKLEPDEVDEVDDEQEMSSAGPSSEVPLRQEIPASDISPPDDGVASFLSATVNRRKVGVFGSSGYVRKRSVLNAALQGLMGEANLSFARGQVEMAEKICLEIIRQNPLAPEPFFTLAEIYESRDKDKFLNFLTIAAHLDPHERDQWIRIADMHIAQGNLQRARIYYTRAIKVLPKDYDLRLRKAKVLEQMNEQNCAMVTYLKMIPHVPLEHAELCLTTAKNVARHFHSAKKLPLALEAMDSAYWVCGHLFSHEDLNLYLELLILSKRYAKAIRCLHDQTRLELETDHDGSDFELVFFCVIPDDFIPDFRAKLCVCLIHLRAHHLLGYLIKNVHDFIPIVHERLDLYIDITEALMHEKKYEEALQLLQPIIDGKCIEPPPFVWLRHAECLRALVHVDKAIASYSRVVELAPYCYDAKFTLAALLKQQGRHLEAVKALEQDLEGDVLNPRLLYERCLMLKEIDDIDQYLEIGYILLGRYSVKLRNREELIAAASRGNAGSFEKKIVELRNLVQNTLVEYNKSVQRNSDLSIQEEYSLFLDLIEIAYSRGKFGALERLCFAVITTKRFTSYHSELERILILACYYNDDSVIGFSNLRDLLSKNVSNNALWNFLSLMIQKAEEMRYHRYIRRLVRRPSCPGIMRIFLGHYHLICCSYKYALNIYVPLLKEHPHPILYLCIAVVFNQLSMQKKIMRKTSAVAQAIAFAQKYSEMRMDSCTEQEIYYNMGRLYHQSGMTHLALDYYKRGLQVRDETIEENDEILGLRQEIAYNIHLIYLAAGNRLMARQYLYKYCVV